MNLKTFSPVGFASALAVLSATAVVSTAAPAKAFAPVTFGYDCNAGTTGAPCTVGQNQFRTTVSQGPQANQVLFTFINKLLPGGSQASSITGISFIDTPLRSLGKILAVNNTQGLVKFNNGSSSNLTGGGRSFSFNSTGQNNSAQIANGVNQGETLSILFQIQNGFTSPIDAVITDLQNKGLGISLTAGGFSGQPVKFRSSFHNSAVPEPLTMLGSGAALGVGALLKKKGSQSKKQKAQVS
jgi:hypothetical protein